MKYSHFLAMASAVIFAATLSACGGGSSGDSSSSEPPPPVPMEPVGPTDLEETQTAAAAAATAAMTASTNADTAADGAETATMHIATRQTNGKAMMYAMDARKYADIAMAEYMKAKAASEAAAAATTGDAGEAAWLMAVTAQEAAGGAAEMAADKAMKAAEAAMTELHIDVTMKSVGDSSIDANMGMLTTTADDGSKTITGMQDDVEREKVGEVEGQIKSVFGTTPVSAYKQAVEARDLTIGKTLDTTDDEARVVVIHSRAGSEMARVYALEEAVTNDIHIRTPSTGDSKQAPTAGGLVGSELDAPTLNSVGMFFQATASEADGSLPNALDAFDEVEEETKGKEVFWYLHLGADGEVGGADDSTRYVVEFTRTIEGGNTDVGYRQVDTTAPAAPDGPDAWW